MTVFSILLTVNETGTRRIELNEVAGVYDAEEKAVEAIYDMANGDKVEQNCNRFEWISYLEEEETYYTTVAFIQEHTLY